jgi:hypothetical protein
VLIPEEEIPVGPVEAESKSGMVEGPVPMRIKEWIPEVKGEREGRSVPRIEPVSAVEEGVVEEGIVEEGVIIPSTVVPAMVVDVVVVVVGRRLVAGLLPAIVPAVLPPILVGVGLLVYLLLMGAPMLLLLRDLELRVTAREAEGQPPEKEQQSRVA